MFSFKKYQLPEAPVDTTDYKHKAEQLEARVKQLEDQLNTIAHETTNEDFVFDFSTVKVFSVERNWKDYRPCTIVGYVINEPYTDSAGNLQSKESVKEWYLYCSKEQHSKLIEQFRNSMKGK